jgi:hypothetical protein
LVRRARRLQDAADGRGIGDAGDAIAVLVIVELRLGGGLRSDDLG